MNIIVLRFPNIYILNHIQHSILSPPPLKWKLKMEEVLLMDPEGLIPERMHLVSQAVCRTDT